MGFATFFEYWRNQRRAFRSYWAIYGGAVSLFKSPYVHVAAILTAESEAKRPVIPTEGGQPIRSKAASDSDRRRPPC
jgi:hypothetical protein